MKKILIYLILLLFSISLVSAVDISTSKNDYSSGDTVTINIVECTGTSILKVRNPSLDTVDIKSGEDTWSTTYNTLSDSADGKYTISVTCTNGAATGNFCVDDPGCLAIQIQEEETTPPSPGSGFLCTSQWSCLVWSYCNADLKQTRDCVDLNKCSQPRKEFKECQQCEESWVCSLWSECFNRDNLRNCFDEHSCKTTLLKPNLQKSCKQVVAPGPQPKRISPQLPPPTSFARPQQPSTLAKFWDNYKSIIVLGVLGLIILVIIVLLFVHFFKPKRIAYNLSELKQWVRKEGAMGTSNEDIRTILKQHTGWEDEEIDKAFEGLLRRPVPEQKPISISKPETSPSLPEYVAPVEEPSVKVDNQPVVQKNMAVTKKPSSSKMSSKKSSSKKVSSNNSKKKLSKKQVKKSSKKAGKKA